MNDDSKEELEKMIPELIKLIESNDTFLIEIAMATFYRKFSKKTLKFDTPPFPEDPYDKDRIVIRDQETAKKLLKYFGHLMSSVLVEMHEYKEHPPKSNLLEFINLYCSKTLRQFEVHGSVIAEEYFFDNFTQPFDQVENLTFFGYFKRSNGIKFTLNELFPLLSRFIIRATQTDMSFVNENFPHLEHFDAVISSYDFPDRMTDAVFRKMIKNNRQIKSLRLQYSTHDLLKFISDELSKLQNLKLVYYEEYASDDIKNSINFDSVKRFVMKYGTTYSMPRNVSFNNLIEFVTDAMPKNSSKWLDFVTQNNSIEKLTLNGRYIEKDEFERITTHNVNLLEFHGIFKLNINHNSVVDFIKNGKRLEKITFEFVATEDLGTEAFFEIMKVLENNFSEIWSIHGNSDDHKIELQWPLAN